MRTPGSSVLPRRVAKPRNSHWVTPDTAALTRVKTRPRPQALAGDEVQCLDRRREDSTDVIHAAASPIPARRRTVPMAVFPRFLLGRSIRVLEWHRSDRRSAPQAPPRSSSRNVRRELFSAAFGFASRSKKAVAGRLPLRFSPDGCRADRPRSHDRHRGRNGVARQERGTRSWRPSAPSPRMRTARASPAR